MGPTSPPLRQRGLAEATLLSECLSGDQAHSSARTASAGDENLLQGSGYKKPLAEEHMEKLKRAIAVNPYARFWRDNNSLARSVIDYTVTFNEQREDGEYIDWRRQAD